MTKSSMDAMKNHGISMYDGSMATMAKHRISLSDEK